MGTQGNAADMRMNKLQEGLQQQRRLIEQLRCEAQITRMRVSQVIEDIVKYCETHREEDVLITGFNKPQENPFKEKGGCTIL
ncbi:guanine nucleotide-binding protein subunit gamma-1-like isoform X1 [Gigantopelta aegis]|uniref:guanine nucleotide-binding protein subunit gamma-1-like isoform X1 n=1 Tax=Gigantopelta aegis TaxID=1735272 RepID=UPI001B889756|nr:guanine nucleotide-binding protein subunit gamma-1-like isoform X1 [Gigantopelta aegis]XP_041357294.1 guanine nucleotide-binding protein subunit gamma-1-like isoform X1 [Gigantopelta aegis]